MGPLKLLSAVLAAAALAGCGGDASEPRLVDGSRAAELPAELAGLDDAVMTRADVLPAGEVDGLVACDLEPASSDTEAVERVGLRGSSATFAGTGASLYACNAIPGEPVPDPDNPGGGIWCSGAAGRLDGDGLNDPRLSLCQGADGKVTAFAWVEPARDAKWVVVSDAGEREVYENIAPGLPVRVTTTENIDPAGEASFDIEEYAGDGARRRKYVLEVAVAG